MADVQTLFNELVGLSKDDAKSLEELFRAKLPKKAAKASKTEETPAEDSEAQPEAASE